MAIDDLRNRDWVLLPGTLCTGDVFRGFLDALGIAAARRKPVSLCHPEIAAYQTALTSQSEGSIICGFSLGAIVAAHHADRLSAHRIILFGVNPFPDDPAKEAGRHDLARDVMAMGGASALGARLPPLLGATPDQARADLLAMADATAPEIEAQTHLALTRPGAIAALSRAVPPVLILTGAEDRMTPAAQGQAAAEAAPCGRFRLLPQLGHYALMEDPAACAQAVVAMEDTFR
ncbi:alpha/beta hydrolase [Antarctobacter sp.]|uniref:alpha/beta fold hydrolase n=1 Tax=Antarctobacter sp. TaxID=1872577 RepID=UPI002B26EAEE|nr:alpha/beta hydrolase [Antarctobacter sp.]